MDEETLDILAQRIAARVLPQVQPQIEQSYSWKIRVNYYVQQGLTQSLEVAGAALGESLSARWGLSLTSEITQEVLNFQSVGAKA